jgi:hypothetical protein
MMTLDEALQSWLFSSDGFFEQRKGLKRPAAYNIGVDLDAAVMIEEIQRNPQILRMVMQLRDGSPPSQAILSALTIGICIGIDMEKEKAR